MIGLIILFVSGCSSVFGAFGYSKTTYERESDVVIFVDYNGSRLICIDKPRFESLLVKATQKGE